MHNNKTFISCHTFNLLFKVTMIRESFHIWNFWKWHKLSALSCCTWHKAIFLVENSYLPDTSIQSIRIESHSKRNIAYIVGLNVIRVSKCFHFGVKINDLKFKHVQAQYLLTVILKSHEITAANNNLMVHSFVWPRYTGTPI